MDTASGELAAGEQPRKWQISPAGLEQALVPEEPKEVPFLKEWGSSRRAKGEFQNEELRQQSLQDLGPKLGGREASSRASAQFMVTRNKARN